MTQACCNDTSQRAEAIHTDAQRILVGLIFALSRLNHFIGTTQNRTIFHSISVCYPSYALHGCPKSKSTPGFVASFVHIFVNWCCYVQYIYTTTHPHIVVLVYCFAMIIQSQ